MRGAASNGGPYRDSACLGAIQTSVTETTAGWPDCPVTRIEQINTQIRSIARRAFGFHSPEPLIALAMLKLADLCRHYLGDTTHGNVRRPHILDGYAQYRDLVTLVIATNRGGSLAIGANLNRTENDTEPITI